MSKLTTDAARHMNSLRKRKGPKPKRTLTCDCGAKLSRTEARTHRCGEAVKRFIAEAISDVERRIGHIKPEVKE